MSVSTENFIKTIYKLEQGVSEDTKPGAIARALGITNAAATDMARKMAARKLIHYKKYRKITLTREGKQMALNIIRKHRLWELFLYKVFNLSLHEIHREAEMLEHQTSDFLSEKISFFLNNPESDPHGDPIPDLDGSILFSKDNIALSAAKPGENYKVSRLFSSEKDFFDFCSSNNIKVGSTVKIEKHYPDSKMTEIRIKNIKLLLNKDFAKLIYVKQTN